jgi:hypothetical protein
MFEELRRIVVRGGRNRRRVDDGDLDLAKAISRNVAADAAHPLCSELRDRLFLVVREIVAAGGWLLNVDQVECVIGDLVSIDFTGTEDRLAQDSRPSSR